MGDPDAFQSLCHEAVLACGEDFAAIERYVLERLASMDERSRSIVRRDLARVIALHVPARPTKLH